MLLLHHSSVKIERSKGVAPALLGLKYRRPPLLDDEAIKKVNTRPASPFNTHRAHRMLSRGHWATHYLFGAQRAPSQKRTHTVVPLGRRKISGLDGRGIFMRTLAD